MKNLLINLFILGLSIILLEDSTNKFINIDIKLNKISNDINSFRYFDYPFHPYKNLTFNYSINNRTTKCIIVKKYGDLIINTKKNIDLLICNTKSYINIIKCSENNCKFKISPHISYRCFPNNLCNVKLFNKITGFIQHK